MLVWPCERRTTSSHAVTVTPRQPGCSALAGQQPGGGSRMVTPEAGRSYPRSAAPVGKAAVGSGVRSLALGRLGVCHTRLSLVACTLLDDLVPDARRGGERGRRGVFSHCWGARRHLAEYTQPQRYRAEPQRIASSWPIQQPPQPRSAPARVSIPQVHATVDVALRAPVATHCTRGVAHAGGGGGLRRILRSPTAGEPTFIWKPGLRGGRRR